MAEDKKLLDDIKSSIMDMQSQMQSTYNALSDIKVTGKSNSACSIKLQFFKSPLVRANFQTPVIYKRLQTS